MKSILLIGVGGTGSSAVDILYQKIKENKDSTTNRISAIVLDTDASNITAIRSAEAISMADTASVGTICDRIGKKYLRDWFPCDRPSVRTQDMMRGASQWRKKSLLAFLNLLNKPEAAATFHDALEEFANADPTATCEIYIIASLAGGTGSGAFIPIALYAKRYLREHGKENVRNVKINAVVACPDIYVEKQSPETCVKIYANAYSILRELNAINLVTRDRYNDEEVRNKRGKEKKAPARLKIGHPEEPYLKLLFDASDPNFWNADHTPFSQVYLLDKISGVHSIRAHEVVLANSLHSMICTDMGTVFDSAATNHVADGSSSIYAAISTSQLVFPIDSVLNYLAHKKAYEACEGEWLTLHTAVENRIRDLELRARDQNQEFFLQDGEYAVHFCDELDRVRKRGKASVIRLVDGENGQESPVKGYFEQIRSDIEARLSSYEDAIQRIDELPEIQKPKFLHADVTKKETLERLDDVFEILKEFYAKCRDTVEDERKGLIDEILTYSAHKDKCASPELSMVSRLIKKKEGSVHPVTALTRLCELRSLIKQYLESQASSLGVKAFRPEEGSLPAYLLSLYGSDYADAPALKLKKSLYLGWGSDRLLEFKRNSAEYIKAHTCPYTDAVALQYDAKAVIDSIRAAAATALQYRVLEEVGVRLDALIAQYRSFFTRFARAKSDFSEAVKMAHNSDSGHADSIINVYSTPKNKDDILNEVFSSSADSRTSLERAMESVGEIVFENNYHFAAAEYNKESRPAGANIYRKLFEKMVDTYKDVISNSAKYQDLKAETVIDAIKRSAGEGSGAEEIKRLFKLLLSTAATIAEPSLQIDKSEGENGMHGPAPLKAVLMSRETAKSIQENAELLGIAAKVTKTGFMDEDTSLSAYAEQFISDYMDGRVNVKISEDVSPHVLYVMGQVIGISPIRIAKFDELSANPVYFNNYKTALTYDRRDDSEMWNPHLGNDFHKRGFLPYMNPKMEELCDEKMVKALLYGLWERHIRLGMGSWSNEVTFRYKNGGTETELYVEREDGKSIPITVRELAYLLVWLRDQDDLIEEWSDAFDRKIADTVGKLPAVSDEEDVELLGEELEQRDIMKFFMGGILAEDMKEHPTEKTTAKNTVGLDIISFAWAIRSSEEATRDCDDAERVVKVASKIFTELCFAKTGKPEYRATIYEKMLEKLYRSFASRSVVKKKDENRDAYFRGISEWMNRLEAFRMIPREGGVQLGNINYAVYTPSKEVKKLMHPSSKDTNA